MLDFDNRSSVDYSLFDRSVVIQLERLRRSDKPGVVFSPIATSQVSQKCKHNCPVQWAVIRSPMPNLFAWSGTGDPTNSRLPWLVDDRQLLFGEFTSPSLWRLHTFERHKHDIGLWLARAIHWPHGPQGFFHYRRQVWPQQASDFPQVFSVRAATSNGEK